MMRLGSKRHASRVIQFTSGLLATESTSPNSILSRQYASRPMTTSIFSSPSSLVSNVSVSNSRVVITSKPSEITSHISGLLNTPTLRFLSSEVSSTPSSEESGRISSTFTTSSSKKAIGVKKLIDLPIDQLKGKTVVVRVDFNVKYDKVDPAAGGDNKSHLKYRVSRDSLLRLQESIPTIRHLQDAGAKIVLLSHLGDPGEWMSPAEAANPKKSSEGEKVKAEGDKKDEKKDKKKKREPGDVYVIQNREKFSLEPVKVELEDMLKCKVGFAPSCVGPETAALVKEMEDGDILLCENARFDVGEQNADAMDAFSRQLAATISGDINFNFNPQDNPNPSSGSQPSSLVDAIYVNDAFGTAHRAHGSIVGLPKYLKGPHVAGMLMAKELYYLKKVFSSPKSTTSHTSSADSSSSDPSYAAIVGGAKVDSKLPVLRQLINQVGLLAIGGAMTTPFAKAQRLSNKEEYEAASEDAKLAKNILDEAKEKGVQVLVPVDVHWASEFSSEPTDHKIISIDEFLQKNDGFALDIGPKSIDQLRTALSTVSAVLWNGPVSRFEWPLFATGTNEVIRILSDLDAVTVAGGGETTTAIETYSKSGGSPSFTHISTGGGASLAVLEGNELPAITALDKEQMATESSNPADQLAYLHKICYAITHPRSTEDIQNAEVALRAAEQAAPEQIYRCMVVIMNTENADSAVRVFCAVFLRRHLVEGDPCALEQMTDEGVDHIKSGLSSLITNPGTSPHLLRQVSECVVSVSQLLLNNDSWPELVPLLLQLGSSSLVSQRQCALHIISLIALNNIDGLTHIPEGENTANNVNTRNGYLDAVNDLLFQRLNDEDGMTRVMAVTTLCNLVSSVLYSDIKKKYQLLIPKVLEIFRQCASSGAEREARQILVELINLVVVHNEGSFFKRYLQTTATVMREVLTSASSDVSKGLKELCLELLTSLILGDPKACVKSKYFLELTLDLIYTLLMSVPLFNPVSSNNIQYTNLHNDNNSYNNNNNNNQSINTSTSSNGNADNNNKYQMWGLRVAEDINELESNSSFQAAEFCIGRIFSRLQKSVIKARILDPIIKVKLHKYIAEHATAEAKHNHLVQQQEKGLVPMNVVSPLLELDWREGVATLTILKEMGENIELEDYPLQEICDHCVKPNHHPRVLFEAISVIERLCYDYAPHFQANYHQHIIPGLVTGLASASARVQYKAAQAVFAFANECEEGVLAPSCGLLLQGLMHVMTNGEVEVQKQVLSAFAGLATGCPQEFSKYYRMLIPEFKKIIYSQYNNNNANVLNSLTNSGNSSSNSNSSSSSNGSNNDNMNPSRLALRTSALEAMTLIFNTVDPELAKPDALELLQHFVTNHKEIEQMYDSHLLDSSNSSSSVNSSSGNNLVDIGSPFDEDLGDHESYLIQAMTRLLAILGDDFFPCVPFLFPAIFRLCLRVPDRLKSKVRRAVKFAASTAEASVEEIEKVIKQAEAEASSALLNGDEQQGGILKNNIDSDNPVIAMKQLALRETTEIGNRAIGIGALMALCLELKGKMYPYLRVILEATKEAAYFHWGQEVQHNAWELLPLVVKCACAALEDEVTRVGGWDALKNGSGSTILADQVQITREQAKMCASAVAAGGDNALQAMGSALHALTPTVADVREIVEDVFQTLFISMNTTRESEDLFLVLGALSESGKYLYEHSVGVYIFNSDGVTFLLNTILGYVYQNVKMWGHAKQTEHNTKAKAEERKAQIGAVEEEDDHGDDDEDVEGDVDDGEADDDDGSEDVLFSAHRMAQENEGMCLRLADAAMGAASRVALAFGPLSVAGVGEHMNQLLPLADPAYPDIIRRLPCMLFLRVFEGAGDAACSIAPPILGLAMNQLADISNPRVQETAAYTVSCAAKHATACLLGGQHADPAAFAAASNSDAVNALIQVLGTAVDQSRAHLNQVLTSAAEELKEQGVKAATLAEKAKQAIEEWNKAGQPPQQKRVKKAGGMKGAFGASAGKKDYYMLMVRAQTKAEEADEEYQNALRKYQQLMGQGMETKNDEEDEDEEDEDEEDNKTPSPQKCQYAIDNLVGALGSVMYYLRRYDLYPHFLNSLPLPVDLHECGVAFGTLYAMSQQAQQDESMRLIFYGTNFEHLPQLLRLINFAHGHKTFDPSGKQLMLMMAQTFRGLGSEVLTAAASTLDPSNKQAIETLFGTLDDELRKLAEGSTTTES